MATPQGASWRNNPFSRNSMSPSPAPARPKSAIVSSPLSTSSTPTHGRNQSASSTVTAFASSNSRSSHPTTNSRGGTPTSNTFAPRFIKDEDLRSGQEQVKGMEGENDFSGKRYVWVNDPD